MSIKIENPYNSMFDAVCIGSGHIKIGKNCEIRKGTIIEMSNGSLELKNESIIGYYSFLQCSGNIIIDEYSLLGPYNVFLASTHVPTKGQYLKNIPLKRSTLHIGKNVWSGSHVTFNKGILVGNNSIIGANSFVNKTIPENEVWGGTPAKFIKKGVY